MTFQKHKYALRRSVDFPSQCFVVPKIFLICPLNMFTTPLILSGVHSCAPSFWHFHSLQTRSAAREMSSRGIRTISVQYGDCLVAFDDFVPPSLPHFARAHVCCSDAL